MSKSRRERRLAQRARSRPDKTAKKTDPRATAGAVRREWIVLGVILIFGLALRMAYLAEIKGSPAFEYPAFDAAFHDHWARCLVSGDWSAPEFHSDPLIHETPFFRPPGYPYFLAATYLLTGKSYIAARIIQMLIGLASCVLLFMLARPFFGRVVGWIAAALMSCYWIFIYFEGELLAPVLIVFFSLASMLMLARWIERTTWLNTIAAGVVLGLFALVRPNALVLLPVALVWIWWVARRRGDSKRWRIALIGFPLGVLLAVAPATIRNYAVSGDLVLITSNAGVNFYIGNNEYTDCVSANVPVLGDITGLGSWTCFDQPAIEAAVERIEGRPLKSSEVSKYFTDKAVAHISAHPGKTVELMWRKALLFWGPAEISNNKVIHFERANSRVLRIMPGFPVALALALVGFILLIIDFRKGRAAGAAAPAAASKRLELTVLLAGFVTAYFASYLPFFIAGRYRVPIIPYLLLFGAYGIERVRWMITQRRMKTAAVWVGALLVVLLATTRQPAEYKPDLGMWHFDRGDAYRKQGNGAQARDEFRMAIEKANAPSAVAHNNLAVALDQMGDYDGAVAQFEQAVEVNPNYLEARRNLVAVLMRTNKLAAATRHQREIVRLEPQDAKARFNLGVLLLRQNELGEAVGHLEQAIRLDPSHYYAQFYLARALRLLDRREDAIAQYAAVVKMSPNQVDARFELASLLAETGRKQEAVTHLTRVLRLKPDHAEARRMLDELGSE